MDGWVGVGGCMFCDALQNKPFLLSVESNRKKHLHGLSRRSVMNTIQQINRESSD